MKTVKEVSRITGVSVRTLHYYDSIGLLKPADTTEAGYRLYDGESLRRLEAILMFREIGFSLAEIGQILDSPDFDIKEALNQHIAMLKLKREHLDGLIFEAERMMKGENADFTAFDRSKMDKYAKEVKERWGNTDAYRESQEKTDSQKRNLEEGIMELFKGLGRIKEEAPDSEEAQAAVKEIQDFITANAYECTNEILAGLGMMYVGDERFRENIDNAGGEGTAEFAAKAIEIYCNI